MTTPRPRAVRRIVLPDEDAVGDVVKLTVLLGQALTLEELGFLSYDAAQAGMSLSDHITAVLKKNVETRKAEVAASRSNSSNH